MDLQENKKLLVYGNIITTIITIVVNMLAVLLPLNGNTTQELSDKYPNLFVPAGYVFSIWSVIYILLIVFAVYQALPRNRDSSFLERISVYFIVTNIANTAWIFLWHYEQVLLSVILMLVLLITLIVIYWRLEIGLKEVSTEEKIAVHVTFSVYLGWITVATVANITALLVSVNWDGFGISDEIWTAIVLLVATIIALIMVVMRKDYAYGLVPVWAFIGITVKQLTNSPTVALVAAVFAGVILLAIVGSFVYSRIAQKE